MPGVPRPLGRAAGAIAPEDRPGTHRGFAMTIGNWSRGVGLVPLALLATTTTLPAADAPSPARRTPWTASKVAGTPDPPPPYRAELAFPHLKFEKPVVLAAAKGLGRIFVVELDGKVYSFPNDPACPRADLAVDLAKDQPEAGSIFGLAFHPDFARNRQVYLCYSTKQGGPEGSRVSRFRVHANGSGPPTIVAKSETILLTWLAGGHNAGCLAFGPDGYLYVAAGDTADPTPPDPLRTGQDISDVPSSILRIDVDHTDPGRAYRVPPDNPFVKAPKARPEVWAFGFRNPWRFSFDRKTGQLWAGDVGWELWEMIHKVDRGGNYGWSIVEGPQPVYPDGARGPGPIVPPVVAHPHSEAGSITGGYVYRGKKLPALGGVYVYGDFQSGKVWGLRHDGSKLVWQGELADTPIQLVSFGEDEEGEVYLLDFERSKGIYKLVPNPSHAADRAFPRRLSQTGLFASTKDHTPAPGVVPYAIIAEMWSDHATAERLLAVPGVAKVSVDESGRWKAPEGTVLARTVSIETERGAPRSRKRIETQVLHLEDGSWRPYTYAWSDDGSDADLADARGSSRTIAIVDREAPGGRRTQSYRINARSECVLCHNPWVEKQTTMFGRQTASPLAFNTSQMNRETNRAGRREEQVAMLSKLGLLDGSPASHKGTPRLVDPYGKAGDLAMRARSYLQVNCAHCHQFGAGGSANIQLRADLALAKTNAVGVRPMQGGFGLDDPKIIAPGDPDGSVLYYRMAKTGGGRMPRAGSDLVDERGVRLIRDWIAGLPRPSGSRPASAADESALACLRPGSKAAPAERSSAIRRLTESTRGGLALMDRIDRGAVDPSALREVVGLAKDLPRAEVRDLLERFVPEADRARRLGEPIDPPAVLGLKGDPGRGERVFFADSSQCASCHRVDGRGTEVGPDLGAIGAKYDRPTLLRHLVEPSLAIEAKYVNYLLETKSGVVHAGILVDRAGGEVALKGAKGESIRVPAAEVEGLVPQAKSAMPEGLLRDLTAQQAADLLEYLATRKGPGR